MLITAGTSYGVSLMWLLAAVQANERAHATSPSLSPSLPPLVIGTEHEPRKAAKAKAHIQEGFGDISSYLSLLEGDILKTLPAANIEKACTFKIFAFFYNLFSLSLYLFYI